jgi:hypothetical protein
MITPRNGALELGFIHGASLPDPHGLLKGSGKAKRHVALRSEGDLHLRRGALEALIRASIDHDSTNSTA